MFISEDQEKQETPSREKLIEEINQKIEKHNWFPLKFVDQPLEEEKDGKTEENS